jgi:hypothetical protein
MSDQVVSKRQSRKGAISCWWSLDNTNELKIVINKIKHMVTLDAQSGPML